MKENEDLRKKVIFGVACVAYVLLLVGVFFIGKSIGRSISGSDDTLVASDDENKEKESTVGSDDSEDASGDDEDVSTADGNTSDESSDSEDSDKENSDSDTSNDSNSGDEDLDDGSSDIETSSSDDTTADDGTSTSDDEGSSVVYAISSGAVDTGNLSAEGDGYEGTVGTGDFNYGEALQKALIFYEEQRSGDLPDTGRVSWRGDSGLTDGSDVGLDLTGGLYDAGDNVKFNLPMAYTSSMLAWSVYEDEEAYQESGQYEYICDTIRWVNDYLIKCHPEDEVYYYQVGDGNVDHSWWGPCEVMQMERPSYCVTVDNPGSCVVGEAAASLAAASVIFAETDPEYSALCLSHAESLYAFAEKTKSDSGYTAANGFYNSWSGFYDELSWAGIWLYLATDDEDYLDKAIEYWDEVDHDYKWTMCWDDVATGAALMLARITEDEKYSDWMENNLDYWTVGVNGEKVTYTSGGLAYLDSWGPLRYATTEAYIALLYADWEGCPEDKAETYFEFAESQINYALGSTGYSYMVGYGDDYPQHVHHRTAQGSYCDNMNEPSEARHVLYGALVGGPNQNDDYPDSVSDYTTSEVACDYNAGFVGALARLYGVYGGQTLVNFGAVETPTDDEIFVEACVNVSGEDFIEIRAYVYNESAWPARVVENVTMRYFVDLTEVYEAGGTVDDLVVTTNYTEGASASELIPWDEENHIYYVLIDFTGTKIYPGGQSSYKKEVQFRIRNENGVWDNSNDPSYAELVGNNGSSLVRTYSIVLYDGDEKIFGNEP